MAEIEPEAVKLRTERFGRNLASLLIDNRAPPIRAVEHGSGRAPRIRVPGAGTAGIDWVV